jgi:hypothetical protein
LACIQICSLHSNCWKASWIAFQLPSWLAAYWKQYSMAGGILKNCWQAPPITFQLTCGLAADIQSAAANIQATTFRPAGLARDRHRKAWSWLTFLLLTSPSDHLLACSLHSYCWQASWIVWLATYFCYCLQASWIAFQLTSCLAAYILTADKPVGLPFSSPLGYQLTENNTGWLEVEFCWQAPQITFQLTSCLAAYIIPAYMPNGSPFSTPLGLQLTFLLLTSQLDGLACSLHSYCLQASWITFQLTSWLAAYILTADKPVGSPFSSPLG